MDFYYYFFYVLFFGTLISKSVSNHISSTLSMVLFFPIGLWIMGKKATILAGIILIIIGVKQIT